MINDSNAKAANKLSSASGKSESSKSQVSESKLDADDNISQSNTLEALEMLKKDEFEWSLPKARNISFANIDHPLFALILSLWIFYVYSEINGFC